MSEWFRTGMKWSALIFPPYFLAGCEVDFHDESSGICFVYIRSRAADKKIRKEFIKGGEQGDGKRKTGRGKDPYMAALL